MKRQWKVVLLSIVCIYGMCLAAMDKKQNTGDLVIVRALAQVIDDEKLLRSSSEILEAVTIRDYGYLGMPGVGEHLSDNQNGTFYDWFYRNASQLPPR